MKTSVRVLPILFVVATMLASSQALNCYLCLAWAGAPSHKEACRSNGVDSGTCNFKNTYVFDSKTNALTGKTLADVDMDDKTREGALASTYCFKQSGTSTTGTAAVIRGCVWFADNTDRNGKCETNPAREEFPPAGTLAPNSHMWTSSATNSNGGTAGTCSSGNSGVAVTASATLLLTVAAFAVFKR